MSSDAIETQGLTRTFGGTCALDHLDLRVPAGTVFGFLGPNGAGKTTTLRLLLGLLEPSAGSARVLGLDVATHAAQVRARCGALLEHHGLYERLSAQDNLEFAGRAWRMAGAARRARARELLEGLGLWERRRERVSGWSRGMKQRLAVARALVHRPALVFLDEPTAGLDPAAAAAFRDEIAGLATREGTTVFLTTHNLAEAERICAAVAVIRGGRLAAVGTPDELRARGRAPRVRLSGRGFGEAVLAQVRAVPGVARAGADAAGLWAELREGADPAPVVSAAVGAGAEVSAVGNEGATLEDAYLSLMEAGR